MGDGMKIFKARNVFEEALERIRWVFDNFEEVICSHSGGKDSTIIFELALIVAREKGRLPLKVFFLDQEAEWKMTIDQIRRVMYHPDVDPMWMQVPFRMSNATSITDLYLNAWDPDEEEKWMHPKDPISFKENVYGVDRFHKMFGAIAKHHFFGKNAAFLAGMRTEESPTRFCAITSFEVCRGVTWGRRFSPAGSKRGLHVTLYPVYDWRLADVWKAILDNGWNYCELYNIMYQYGVPYNQMRVSNIHHETAVRSLWYLQEVEPETYERLVARIGGIDMAAKMGKDDYFVKELPFMFSSWWEYRDYLLEHLVADEKRREGFRKIFKKQDDVYGEAMGMSIPKLHVQSILTNDFEYTKLQNFERSPEAYTIRKGDKKWSV